MNTSIFVLLLLITAIACQIGSQREGITLQLDTDKAEYRIGEPVSLRLTVTNSGNQPISIGLSSTQVYDFVVRREGQEIWRWAADKMFAMMLTDLNLKAGESRTYVEVWPQVNNNGQKVAAGSYEVIGLLATQPPRSSVPRSISVR